MWESAKLTAYQWGTWYRREIGGFFSDLGPDGYMTVLVVAFIAALAFLRMNFGR